MNMNFVDFYANRIWPIHRKFVKLDRRCDNCILSKKHMYLWHNKWTKSHICSYCDAYIESHPDAYFTDMQDKQVDTPLDATLIQKMTDNGVLLLLSGGKDSLYTLSRFRNEFPFVNISCLTVNTGFIQQEVFDRCSRFCNKINVNHLVWNHDIPTFFTRYQQTFKSLKTQTGNKCVDFDEGSVIFQIAEAIAALSGNVVVSGLSIEQCEDIAETNTYYQKTYNGVDFFYPMMYWQGLTDDIIYKYLRDVGINDNLSPVVSNNQLIPAMSAIDILNHGYCGFELEMSKRIRSRRTKRTPWLHRFEMLEYMTKKGLMNRTIDETLSKLQLTRADVLTNPS